MPVWVLQRSGSRVQMFGDADTAIRVEDFRPAAQADIHSHRRTAVKFKELASDTSAESLAEIRHRVVRAASVQLVASAHMRALESEPEAVEVKVDHRRCEQRHHLAHDQPPDYRNS